MSPLDNFKKCIYPSSWNKLTTACLLIFDYSQSPYSKYYFETLLDIFIYLLTNNRHSFYFQQWQGFSEAFYLKTLMEIHFFSLRSCHKFKRFFFLKINSQPSPSIFLKPWHLIDFSHSLWLLLLLSTQKYSFTPLNF